MRITKQLVLYAAALAAGAAAVPAVAANDYRWPDNIPPEAKALLQSPPLSPTGQVVPGYPQGAPASSPDVFKFSPEQIAKLKAGHYTAGIVMQTMDAGWPMLQIRGITETLKGFGIDVVATTNAKFQPGKQTSDLEEVIARKPDVIFSIPLDPLGESAAYKKVPAAGIKLVFMDNVATDMTPGKDYVSVTASDNESNAYFATKQLAEKMGGQGEMGFITLVYEYYYSVAARKVGMMRALKEYPGIKLVETGTIASPEKAYGVATAMMTAHPDLKGIFVAWDTPAEQVVSAAKTLGRKIIVTTNDVAVDSAYYVARGDILAIGAQRPYDQGVAEAKSAAYALLGEQVPPYIEVPTLRVTKLDLLSALKDVTKEDPPQSLVKLCDGKCF